MLEQLEQARGDTLGELCVRRDHDGPERDRPARELALLRDAAFFQGILIEDVKIYPVVVQQPWRRAEPIVLTDDPAVRRLTCIEFCEWCAQLERSKVID